jgi:hypothetical protein
MKIFNSELKALEEAQDLSDLQAWLNCYCQEKGHDCWHQYGPADPVLYHSSNPRVMLINSESGGYEECGQIPSDEYLKWIQSGWNTPRYSAVFVTAIRKHIDTFSHGRSASELSPSWYRECFQDGVSLAHSMRNTIYMNARITSNDSNTPHEQKPEVMSDVHEFALYREKFVDVMRPEIIISGGKSARECVSHSLGLFDPWAAPTKPVEKFGKYIVVTMPHFSRPQLFGGYAGLDSIAKESASLFLSSESKSDL